MAGEVGADISYFQNFNASQYGYQFIFIRATFGVSMIDPQFVNFRNQARSKGISFRAYYHFLVANVDAQTQFNFFANVVGSLQPGENVMIDDEAYSPTGGLPSAAMVQQFSQLCFNHWGIWPIHYSLAGRLFQPDPQTNASYSSANPGGDFWQYSDGTYNYTSLPKSAGGIGNCDMNRCNGTLSSYFIGGAAPVQKTPSMGGGMGLQYRPVSGHVDDVYIANDGSHHVLHAFGPTAVNMQQEDLGGWADERFPVTHSWDSSESYYTVECVGGQGIKWVNTWHAGSWTGWTVATVGNPGTPMVPMPPPVNTGPPGPAGKDGAPGNTLDQATVDQMVAQSVSTDVAPAVAPAVQAAVASALSPAAIADAIAAAMKSVPGA